jgi:hypothetical protein
MSNSDATENGGLIANALGAMTAAIPVGGGNMPVGGGTVDMASVLAKIQSLERDKQALSATIASRDGTIASKDVRLAKFQEGKSAEMETLMTSTISKWLEGLDTKDVAAKEQLKMGLDKLIKEGDDASGVWNVIACASHSWIANVNSIESLTNEVNSYKEKEKELQGGMFLHESNRVNDPDRKRKMDEISPDTPKDIWSEFESIMMDGGGNRGEVGAPGGGMVNINSVR